MDLDRAISTHADWKRRLEFYLAKPDGSLDGDQVADPTRCELGAWLHGEGAVLSGSEDFERLKLVHQAFHTAAADVLRRAHAGVAVRSEVLLGSGSLYARSSSAVIHAIMRLRGRTRVA